MRREQPGSRPPCLVVERAVVAHESVFYAAPVEELPEVFDVVSATVLVVEVVGVFPHVEAEERVHAPGERVARIGFGKDVQAHLLVGGEPYPA